MSLRRHIQAFVIVGSAFTLGLLAGATTVTHAAQEGANPYDGLDTFARALTTIEAYFVEERDTRGLVNGAIRGLVAELDTHSTYLAPEEHQALQDDTEKTVVGIGAEIIKQGSTVIINRVVAGSPAEIMEVRPGDRLLAIDAESVGPLSLAEMGAKLRGPAGTKVALELARGETTREVNIVRDRVLDTGLSIEVANRVAYLRVTRFRRGLGSLLEQRLADLPDLQGAIIDLRGNPGGLLDEAVGMVDLFVERGNIVATHGRGGALIDQAVANPGAHGFPLVVLVDGRSASASEVVAGALQALDRAQVAGTQSYGKGSVQKLFAFEDGSALKLTVASYTVGDGQEINDVGVAPDLTIEAQDPVAQLKTALQSLDLPEQEQQDLVALVDRIDEPAQFTPSPAPFEHLRTHDPTIEAAWQAIHD